MKGVLPQTPEFYGSALHKTCCWINILFFNYNFIKHFAPMCGKKREWYLIQTDYLNLSVTTYLINLKKPEREKKKSLSFLW